MDPHLSFVFKMEKSLIRKQGDITTKISADPVDDAILVLIFGLGVLVIIIFLS
ncbi:unnamed protein product, partial [marine sediment metagenome]